MMYNNSLNKCSIGVGSCILALAAIADSQVWLIARFKTKGLAPKFGLGL